MHSFHVSRATIRHALGLLTREGFISPTPGRGTVVLDFRTSQSLNTVTSISETLIRKGFRVWSRALYVDEIVATPQLARELAVAEGACIKRVQRIQMADSEPVAIMHNYIRAELVPGLETKLTPENTLYKTLQGEYGIIVNKAKDKITAKAASFAEAQMLDVAVDEPLIAFLRVCYDGDQPICSDHLSIVGKKYEFELTLDGRNA